MARIPENVGAPNDVPPATLGMPLPSRNPFEQLVESEPEAQKRYPSWFGDAFSEISGTSRAPSAGTPVPVCHEGLPKRMLLPPPPASSPFVVDVSFQTSSGMYSIAELFELLFDEFQ